MEKKNKKISAGVRRYYKTKKRTHKIKMIAVSILMSTGLLLAGYQATMQIKFNIMVARAESIDAITENQAKEIYNKMTNWDILDKSEVIPIITGEAVILPREPVIKSNKQKMKEWVLSEVRKAGLCPGEVDCLIFNESSWNDFAYNVNKNGAGVDRGLYQFSDIWHKEVSNKCAFSYKCATEHFIRIVKQDKNFHQWHGYTKNCM